MANHTAGPDACSSGIECWLDENVALARLLGTLLVLLVAWGIVKVAERAVTRSARRYARIRRLDEQRTRALVGRTGPLRLTIGLAVFIISVLSVLAIWGLTGIFAGMLAGAGFLGIVIGLAAGDTIGDIIAGFLIFYNHPFDIGDWVDIDGVEGIVEEVALGATRLVTWDNERVTIPNRLVEGTKVKNYSASRKLRRRLIVGVEYGSHLGLAMKTMVEVAKAHPEVLKEPEPTAVTVGFGASSVDLQLRFYVEPVRSSAIKVYTDLLHQVHDTFRRTGIGIAFPHVQIVQGGPWRVDASSTPPGPAHAGTAGRPEPDGS